MFEYPPDPEWHNIGILASEAREWVAIGLTNPRLLDAWRQAGFTDQQIHAWAFTGHPVTAQEWKRTRLRPEVAREWLQADQATTLMAIRPRLAKTLHTAGWEPHYAVAARLALADKAAGIWFDADQAVSAWIKGMPPTADPRVLAAYLCAGFGLAEARSDLDANRTDLDGLRTLAALRGHPLPL